MHYDYRTKGVCAQHISFSGGCNGNLKAISRLVDGWTVDKIEQCLRGNLCGGKQTSCADQLAIAVCTAYQTQ